MSKDLSFKGSTLQRGRFSWLLQLRIEYCT